MLNPIRSLSVMLLTVWALLLPSITYAETSSTTADKHTPTVLVWGDSLSAAYGIAIEDGWVALLQKRLGDDFKVINGSISGETTDGGLSRLPEALKTHQPNYLLIELGANDGLRGLATERLQANLDNMIRLAKDANAKVVLIGIHLPPNYGMAYTERFDKVYQDLAKEYELAFIPFLLEGVALDFDLMQADGLHPTAAAQPKILDHVWQTLEGVFYPERKADVEANRSGSTADTPKETAKTE